VIKYDMLLSNYKQYNLLWQLDFRDKLESCVTGYETEEMKGMN